MQAADAIVFQEVTKVYGQFHALSQLSFAVRPGELYGLIGPNGAGKTTAIRLLVGLQQATDGTIRVLGRAPQDATLRPLLGYMPQDMSLYLDLTVRENLALFGRLYDIPRKQLDERIAELLEFVDLTQWRNTVISNLSGGMRHRASLAVALLPKPQLLVLDEPTVGVDPELRAAFWERFAAMRREGTTILLTTHYMDEAMRCERVGLISRGKLLAEGSPQQLTDQAEVKTLEAAFLKLASRHKKEDSV